MKCPGGTGQGGHNLLTAVLSKGMKCHGGKNKRDMPPCTPLCQRHHKVLLCHPHRGKARCYAPPHHLVFRGKGAVRRSRAGGTKGACYARLHRYTPYALLSDGGFYFTNSFGKLPSVLFKYLLSFYMHSFMHGQHYSTNHGHQ